MALGVLIPGAIAALLTFMLVPRAAEQLGFGDVPDSERGQPAELARAAAQGDELRPIVLRGDRTALGSGPAGPATESARPAPPSALEIPALGVHADVERVGSTATGIEVPQVGRAGWFDEGPRPGEPGRSVVIGHLDSESGPGLFALLPGVKDGTEIAITDAADVVHRYRVVGKAQVPKAAFPHGAVYGPSESEVLVLITCGGPYTPGYGYRDNVLVYARAVS
jgi:hypothetical protein